jgi:hypothetical protein
VKQKKKRREYGFVNTERNRTDKKQTAEDKVKRVEDLLDADAK